MLYSKSWVEGDNLNDWNGYFKIMERKVVIMFIINKGIYLIFMLGLS